MVWTKEQVEMVNKNLSTLTANIKCNVTLLSSLISRGLITDEEKGLILEEKGDYAKASKLLEILKTKKGGFDGLVAAVQQANQTGAHTLLTAKVEATSGDSGEGEKPGQLVVGAKECQFIKVSNSLMGCSTPSNLIQNWETLAYNLDIPEVEVNEIRQGRRRGDILDKNIIFNVLQKWKNEKTSEATLANLIAGLRETGLNDAADKMRNEFKIPKE